MIVILVNLCNIFYVASEESDAHYVGFFLCIIWSNLVLWNRRGFYIEEKIHGGTLDGVVSSKVIVEIIPLYCSESRYNSLLISIWNDHLMKWGTIWDESFSFKYGRPPLCVKVKSIKLIDIKSSQNLV